MYKQPNYRKSNCCQFCKHTTTNEYGNEECDFDKQQIYEYMVCDSFEMEKEDD